MTYFDTESQSARSVEVEGLSDGTMKCILAKKDVTYTVVLSMSAGANVKGYCAVSVNGAEPRMTVPMSKNANVGVESLCFTITPARDNTAVSFLQDGAIPRRPL